MTGTEAKTPKWYQKKRYVIPAALIGLSLFLGQGSSNQATTNNDLSHLQNTQTASTTVVKTQTATVLQALKASSTATTTTKVSSPIKATTQTSNTQGILSNDNHYTNVDGNQVHSPAYSTGGVPAGASAQCRDGTYSFSQHRSGTCSHHGGVTMWY